MGRLDRESLRCLRFLNKEPAQLGWPCRNTSIHWLIEKGFAEITRHFTARWNNRDNPCAQISITESGRRALQEAERS